MNTKARYSLLSLLLLPLVMGGCKRSVYDDMSLCSRTFGVQPYVQTSCDALPSYPKTVKQLRVLAFDENGLLSGVYEDKAPTLGDSYRLPIEIDPKGKVTFVAWAGEDLSSIEFSKTEIGKTKMEDISIAFAGKDGEGQSHPRPLFVGKQETDPKSYPYGTDPTIVRLNLRELTYRLHFTIRGLSQDRKYVVTLADNNTTYRVDGSMTEGKSIVYTDVLKEKQGYHTAELSTLALQRGHKATLTIREEGKEETIWHGDLLEDLLFKNSSTGEKPPYVLECDHDFNVSLTLKQEHGSYMVVQARVNDWNIIERDVNIRD